MQCDPGSGRSFGDGLTRAQVRESVPRARDSGLVLPLNVSSLPLYLFSRSSGTGHISMVARCSGTASVVTGSWRHKQISGLREPYTLLGFERHSNMFPCPEVNFRP